MAKIMEFRKKESPEKKRAKRQSKVWKQSKEWIFWVTAIYLADLLAYLTSNWMSHN